MIYYYEVLPEVAEYFIDSNQIEKAVGVWEKHVSNIQYFLDKNPDDVGFLNNLSDAYKRIGDTYAGYDEEAKSFRTNDKLRLEKAKEYYQNAIENYEKTQTIYPPTPGEIKALDEIREKILKLQFWKSARIGEPSFSKSVNALFITLNCTSASFGEPRG